MKIKYEKDQLPDHADVILRRHNPALHVLAMRIDQRSDGRSSRYPHNASECLSCRSQRGKSKAVKRAKSVFDANGIEFGV